jgi:hypothetical protein
VAAAAATAADADAATACDTAAGGVGTEHAPAMEMTSQPRSEPSVRAQGRGAYRLFGEPIGCSGRVVESRETEPGKRHRYLRGSDSRPPPTAANVAATTASDGAAAGRRLESAWQQVSRPGLGTLPGGRMLLAAGRERGRKSRSVLVSGTD